MIEIWIESAGFCWFSDLETQGICEQVNKEKNEQDPSTPIDTSNTEKQEDPTKLKHKILKTETPPNPSPQNKCWRKKTK